VVLHGPRTLTMQTCKTVLLESSLKAVAAYVLKAHAKPESHAPKTPPTVSKVEVLRVCLYQLCVSPYAIA
jgi:hypothetical protein